MTINRITADTALLPGELLPAIKEHCRVRHTRDDALLTTYTAAAISLVERKCNVCLNPAEYISTTDDLLATSCARFNGARVTWILPLNNVRTVAVTTEAGDDLSADFELWNPDLGGNGASFLTVASGKSLPTTATLTLEVGVVAADDLAPAFTALIARIVGSYYETREANTPLLSDSFDDELMALWRPST